MKPDIIFENNDMIICSKPAGMLAQSDRSFDRDMVSALLAYRRDKKEKVYIAVINRLDRPVSGLMAFAKSPESAKRLSALMQQDTFNKTYMALIVGQPPFGSGQFVDYIIKNGRENISVIAEAAKSGAKRAELSYELLKTREIVLESGIVKVSLVKIHLVTGRHHQIRVQFASRGMAVVGDFKYANIYAEVKMTDNGLPAVQNTNMEEIMHKLCISDRSIALCACGVDIDGMHFEITPDFEKI